MLLRGRGLFVSSPPAHRPQYGRRGLRRERSFSVSGLMPTPALSSNAGVARSGLQNRGLQVRFLLGLFLNGYASGGSSPRSDSFSMRSGPALIIPNHWVSRSVVGADGPSARRRPIMIRLVYLGQGYM